MSGPTFLDPLAYAPASVPAAKAALVLDYLETSLSLMLVGNFQAAQPMVTRALEILKAAGA
jgi:hypothetical protein